MDKILEKDLYPPVKEYLESLGYDVKAEVKDCDITATKDDELIIVELKTGFTLELIYQGLRRQRIADSVYVAAPFPKKGYMAPKYKDMVALCKQLELGLIWVAFTSKGKPQIDVAVHPKEFAPLRRNNKKRLAVLTEHNGRTGSVNTGGVTRRKIITVYKEDSLRIVKILVETPHLKTSEIRELSNCEKTSTILNRNFYKWFERHGDSGKNYTYTVTETGLDALKEYNDLIED